MTDLHATQIVNPQRNSNTILQNSTLQSNSNALSKCYSFQTFRTIKGNVVIDINSGLSNFTVLNMYDGSPLKLSTGDIVLGIVISNATYVQPITAATEFFDPTYNKYPQPWSFNGYPPQTPGLTFLLTQKPQYNPGVNIPKITEIDSTAPNQTISYNWTPNVSGNPTPLNTPFNNASTGPLEFATYPPNGCNIPVTYLNSVDSYYQWITCNSVNLGMNGGVAAINVTFLILNPLSVE
jgi:hypothetical protein